jgi:hypothetical protein
MAQISTKQRTFKRFEPAWKKIFAITLYQNEFQGIYLLTGEI